MILQFKAKPKGRMISRPDLGPQHVVEGGPFNAIQFKMAIRKLYRISGEYRLPKELDLDNLPRFVTADESGFLAVVTVDYSAAH